MMTSVQFSSWYSEWLTTAEKRASSHVALSQAQLSLLQYTYEHSAYLGKLLQKHPDILITLESKGADASWQEIIAAHQRPFSDFASIDELSKHLRQLKQRAALLIALADISEEWQLRQVTMALSQLAENSVELALNFLLYQAHNGGEIVLKAPKQPAQNSGVIILGMGKLGGFELNYSSDIDLIVFYEASKLEYTGRKTEPYFLNKITQDLVKLMQERTADGYVFRTDLRLRPDPSSTPLAVSVDAALHYYESLGQNWERAAMIKARPIGGDLEAGKLMMKNLGAYVWRRSLDFASIQDILSIKRQIAIKVGTQEQLYGHNIKLGKGGIREIEFFVQLHQLIWGGRQLELRGRETVATIHTLVELEHIDNHQAQMLIEAYEFYRKLEHRLQMVDDQQTHTMPETGEEFANIASFMGYDDTAAFEVQLSRYINTVHEMFSESFDSEGLSAADGNLVFTGTSPDPDTLNTLKGMGFDNPDAVSQTVMDWHRGSRRCTRSKLARQLLTELVPDILKALSNTVDPNGAFIRFDSFLLELPVGVQLFSLFQSNPHVIQLLADIMGTSPTLSSTLSRRPQLIETALFSEFYRDPPNKEALRAELEEELEHIEHYDFAMEYLRQFKNEKHFQAGIQLLRNFINSEEVGGYLSDIADILIDTALRLTMEEFATQYGALPGGRCCIIALGKLGSLDLSYSSDVDLMFVYDFADEDAVSDGKNPHSPSVYYNRLSQRMVNALTAIGTNGALYEVDTRLRPAGEQGMLAVSKASLAQYFHKDAWTFERMALCRARAMAGDQSLQDEVTKDIEGIICYKRNVNSLRQDVVDMRNKVEETYGTKDIWAVKHAPGGLMDIDFTAQFIVLASAFEHPDIMLRRSRDVLQAAIKNEAILQKLGIEVDDLQQLIGTSHFISQLQHMLRLTSENPDILNNPPTGLAKVLTSYMQQSTYDELINTLMELEKNCRSAYMRVMKIL